MSAFEIVISVVLCLIGSSTVVLGCYITLLGGKILEKIETQKKPAPKNEADKDMPTSG